MERWKREREMERQKKVAVPQAQARNFASMKPNFDELSKFEDKVQRLAERQEDRDQQPEVEQFLDKVRSTAGAGSGYVLARVPSTHHTAHTRTR